MASLGNGHLAPVHSMVIVMDGNVFPQHGVITNGNSPVGADHNPSTNENLVSQEQLSTGRRREFNEPADVSLIPDDDLASPLRNIKSTPQISHLSPND
jgi:hypothetical protein